jgi:hypothetical protein
MQHFFKRRVLLPQWRAIHYDFSPGTKNYFKLPKDILDREMRKREERAIEYSRTKNEIIDPEDFTKGPKPWLNPNFPSNKSLLPVQLDYIPQKHQFSYSLITAVPNPNENQETASWQPLHFTSALTISLKEFKLSELERVSFVHFLSRFFFFVNYY